MPRKVFIIFILMILSFTGLTLYYAYLPKDTLEWTAEDYLHCPFCQQNVIKRQQFFEGEKVRVLYNYQPLLEGHSLIIPKRHVDKFEDLSDRELLEMKSTIQKVHQAFLSVYGKEGYVLVLQNGKTGGQTVPHVHFHMLPRGKEKYYLTKFKIWLTFLSGAVQLRKPISDEEINSQTRRLQETMQALSFPNAA
jgi:histidine triad (HIT) family protein